MSLEQTQSAFDGMFAVEPYKVRTRCKPSVSQHVVKFAAETGDRGPWNWNVETVCGQQLYSASVKGGKFLEPPVCKECTK